MLVACGSPSAIPHLGLVRRNGRKSIGNAYLHIVLLGLRRASLWERLSWPAIGDGISGHRRHRLTRSNGETHMLMWTDP